MSQPSRPTDARGGSPLAVRNAITVSAVMIFAHLFGFLAPRVFFARDARSAPALYWMTMPARLLVYPVCFIFQAAAVAALTLACWLILVVFAPLIWWGVHRMGTSPTAAFGPGTGVWSALTSG